MILPNLAFDALLFGLLFVAGAIDSAFPVTHGAASLLVVGGATYWAAQELSEWLLRRVGWSQESLVTSVALCVAGFLYFWFRNQSDLALLGLSIGLMMGSLMLAISILAAAGAVLREGRATSLVGWIADAVLATLLGATAGLLILVLGQSGTDTLPLKLGGIVGAFVLWKVRESLAPPATNAHYAAPGAAPGASPVAPAQTPRPALFPQRGTLLDRLVPLLVLGIISLIAARGMISLEPSTPAIAAPNATPNAAPVVGTDAS